MRPSRAIPATLAILAIAAPTAAARPTIRVETVKQFRLIEQLLTPEDEELTPTMKLRRTFVNVKYKELIDSMYERSEG